MCKLLYSKEIRNWGAPYSGGLQGSAQVLNAGGVFMWTNVLKYLQLRHTIASEQRKIKSFMELFLSEILEKRRISVK